MSTESIIREFNSGLTVHALTARHQAELRKVKRNNPSGIEFCKSHHRNEIRALYACIKTKEMMDKAELEVRHLTNCDGSEGCWSTI